MATHSLAAQSEALGFTVHTRQLRLRSRMRHEFIDVTAAVADAVRQSRVRHGLVCVQTATPAPSSAGTSGWWVTSWRGCIRQTTVVAPGAIASTPRTVAPSEVVSSCTEVVVDSGRCPAAR